MTLRHFMKILVTGGTGKVGSEAFSQKTARAWQAKQP